MWFGDARRFGFDFREQVVYSFRQCPNDRFRFAEMERFDKQTDITSPTGARINLYVEQAGEARGVLQINHGLAEHAARYARFAKAAAKRGYHVYAHDHRGHGMTTAPDAPARSFAEDAGIEKVLDDVAAVHDRIAGEHPDLPVICFGHSMGGLVALNFAMRDSNRLSGLAVFNANFSAGLLGRVARALLAAERFRLGADAPSRILPKVTFQAWAAKIPDRKTDFDWLSHDPEEVRKYIDDPLCGWDASVGMWQDVSGLVFRGADDGNLARIRRDLPICLVGGEHDPSTDGGKAVRALASRFEKLDFKNVTTRIYENTRHESLNEVNREQVTAEFLDWADTVT